MKITEILPGCTGSDCSSLEEEEAAIPEVVINPFNRSASTDLLRETEVNQQLPNPISRSATPVASEQDRVSDENEPTISQQVVQDITLPGIVPIQSGPQENVDEDRWSLAGSLPPANQGPPAGRERVHTHTRCQRGNDVVKKFHEQTKKRRFMERDIELANDLYVPPEAGPPIRGTISTAIR